MIKLMKESDVNENKKAFYRMMNAVQGRIAKKYGVETKTHEGQIYDDFGNATIYLLKNGKTIGFVDLWYDFGNDPDYPDRDTFITVKWRSENEYEDHRIDTVTFEGATNELERTGGIVNQIVSNYNGNVQEAVKNYYYNDSNPESRRKSIADRFGKPFVPDDHMLVCKDGKIINVQVGKKYRCTSCNGQRVEIVSVDKLYDDENGQSASLTVAYRGKLYGVGSNQIYESSEKNKKYRKSMNESYTIETVNEICATLKKDVDKISYIVNKYPDNYNMDDLVSRLIDIETELYEIWR